MVKLGNPIEIAAGVHQVRAIGAKVTVLTTGEGTVLVDAGMRGSLGLISAGLQAMGLLLEQVRLIVLTHHHPDHSGGLGELVKATSAKVAAHHRDAGIISGAEPAPSPYRNPLVAGVTRPFTNRLYGEPVDVDYLLEDGDRLPADREITVVHAPGHTPGSICLFMPSDRVLIVGDALEHRRRRLGPPSASFTQDPAQAAESLRKLLPLEFETICFSHFPALKSDARGALRRLVQKTAPEPAVDT